VAANAFKLQFDPGTIKHLGLQMYTSLPPVIGELIANAWDANATRVNITVPITKVNDESTIIVQDDGDGMTDAAVRSGYLVTGRDRREALGDYTTVINDVEEESTARKVMGRKGIGKFSAFGVARVIEVETVSGGEHSRFRMDYDEMLEFARKRQRGEIPPDAEFTFPPLGPTGNVEKGTRVTLSNIAKFRTRRIELGHLRQGIARRFAVLDAGGFVVAVNKEPITATERDLRSMLARDPDGGAYLWEIDEEIQEGTGWRVEGFVGALPGTDRARDEIDRGITIMARGKLVQEPFVFEAVVGQQYALSYLVGELTADFVDEGEDFISTGRNSLIWDAEPNAALKIWGQKKLNRIAREWGERRSDENKRRLESDPLYQEFKDRAGRLGTRRAGKVADALIRKVVSDNVLGDERATRTAIQLCLDFMEFDSFVELAAELRAVEDIDVSRLMELFREWEVLEAKEMMRVTEGRIETIRRLGQLIEGDALEVPTLHAFLKEFPWVLDPRWTLIADEVRYSGLLREHFPETSLPETDRRVDFLCVREGTQLVVVEIKRPSVRASRHELEQIEEYVHFMRDAVQATTDPDSRFDDVVGYLLVGDVVKEGVVQQKVRSLAQARIYVRRYRDLLTMVENDHKDFLQRYELLRDRPSPDSTGLAIAS
jgi:hypothetical protein